MTREDISALEMNADTPTDTQVSAHEPEGMMDANLDDLEPEAPRFGTNEEEAPQGNAGGLDAANPQPTRPGTYDNPETANATDVDERIPPPTTVWEVPRLNPSETHWRRMRHVNDDGSWTHEAHEFRAYACRYFSRSTHVCGHANGINSTGSNQYFLRLKCSTCNTVIYRAAMNRR